jgi:hypothetical protein
MKIFIALISSLLLLSGCNTNKVIPDKPVNLEVHIIHSKLTSYDNFPIDDRRDWPDNFNLSDVLNELPKGSNPEIIYSTNIQTTWDNVSFKEDKNSIKWDLYKKGNFEKISNLNPDMSKFKIEFKPTLQTARNLLLINYSITLFKETRYAEYSKTYYPFYETFCDAKIFAFTRDKYHVSSVIALDNKESLIVIYKVTN